MAADLTFRAALPTDALAIAPRLRDADLKELQASHGRWLDVEKVLVAAVVLSRLCWAGLEDDRPVMLFGVVPVSLLGAQGACGSPWMLGTPEVLNHGKTLVKKGKEFVDLMHHEFPALVNYVDTQNKVSKRWLRRIGFVVYPPSPYGLLGKPFHRFDRSAEKV